MAESDFTVLFDVLYKFADVSTNSDALLPRSNRINQDRRRALLLGTNILQLNNVLISKLTRIFSLTIFKNSLK